MREGKEGEREKGWGLEKVEKGKKERGCEIREREESEREVR